MSSPTLTQRKVADHSNGHSNGNGHTNGNGVAHQAEKARSGYGAFGVHGSHVTWTWWILTVCGLIVVPFVVYWCWICTEYNKGEMILPYYTKSVHGHSTYDLSSWWDFVSGKILDHAIPSFRAWKIYLLWTAFQAILFKFGPGHKQKGVELKGGERLEYTFNGQFAFFTTLVVAFYLHYTNTFNLTALVDLFPEMLTVCIIWCSLVIGGIYLFARINGTIENQTDSILYDYFMGPQLNPMMFKGQALQFDIKWFYELRPGIMHWFFTTLAFAARQYDDLGYISIPMALVCFYHLCFVNACYKGEHCVIWTMDIIHEKFGWMLLMLDIVMVPFVFPMQAYYVYRAQPDHHIAYYIFFASMHIIGYYIFDTANSQKDYFREKPDEAVPSGFPRLPWGRLKNPKYIQTKRGTKLLVDGWWQYARHCNYLGDILMSWSWGLTCGYTSIFPFAYTAYLTPLLIHREIRDDLVCSEKYGDDWDKYKKAVPYRICPYVY